MVKMSEIVAGALCGFVGILLGSFWLSGSVDWITKLLASIGSLATAGSFIYIIAENRKIRKAQEKQENRQIAHEVKQQEMWDLQMETINFQKYESHKKMFSNILVQIEEKFENKISFDDKDGLYNSLFPENSPLKCSLEIDINSSEQQWGRSSLAACLDLEKQLIESYDYLKSLNTMNASPAGDQTVIRDFIDRNASLALKLHVKFEEVEYIGDVNRLGDKAFNVFEPIRNMERLSLVLYRICIFVNVEHRPLVHAHSEVLAERVLNWFFGLDFTSQSIIRGNLGSKETLVRFLFRCRKFFKNLEDDAISSRQDHVSRTNLTLLFTDKEKILSLIESNDEIIRVVSDIANTIGDIDSGYLSDAEQEELSKISKMTMEELTKKTYVMLSPSES